jgi:signal transduction histidine kinase
VAPTLRADRALNYAILAAAVVAATTYAFREYLQYRLSLRGRRLGDYANARMLASSPEVEFLRELLRTQTEALAKTEATVVNVGVGTAGAELHSSKAATNSRDASLVRELAHSLNTPLSQIEIAATRIATLSNNGDPELMERIRNGVRLCNAFLAAFQEVETIAGKLPQWQPKDLRNALISAATLYCASSNRTKLVVNIDVPDRIAGYSNSFVLALMLPLLENAIEAAPDDSTVAVRFEQSGNTIELYASNLCEPDFVNNQQIYEAGYSTKGHRGLGLAVVRRLLSAREGAGVTHSYDGAKITFQLTLPRGGKDAA